MDDDRREPPESGNREGDDIVMMASELGCRLHPSADVPANGAESRQKRNADHELFGLIVETVLFAKRLSETRE